MTTPQPPATTVDWPIINLHKDISSWARVVPGEVVEMRYAHDIMVMAKHDIAELARVIDKLLARPDGEAVAWRVKDYADSWILFHDEKRARHEATETGALFQPLYTHAKPDGEAVRAEICAWLNKHAFDEFHGKIKPYGRSEFATYRKIADAIERGDFRALPTDSGGRE